MAEWLKATDCKSVRYAYAGSNPALSTITFTTRPQGRVLVCAKPQFPHGFQIRTRTVRALVQAKFSLFSRFLSRL